MPFIARTQLVNVVLQDFASLAIDSARPLHDSSSSGMHLDSTLHHSLPCHMSLMSCVQCACSIIILVLVAQEVQSTWPPLVKKAPYSRVLTRMQP